MRLLCALGLFLALLHVTSCLLIGAFNIQQFGDKKSQNKDVMATIKEIVLRYDIILIQEVLDKDLTITKRLMDLVNEDDPQFRYIPSEYLPLDPHSSHKRAKRAKCAKRAKGAKRGNYRERYLFLYRHQKVSVTGCFQYDEGKRGVFDRPPFVVKFSSTQTDVEFVLIPIHTSPLTAAQAAKEGRNSTVEQLNALVDVVEEAKLKLKTNNIMVLGDFNAGGVYVPKGKLDEILRIRKNKDFHWLIADNVDTTVSRLKFAYDRIVVTTEMEKGVVAGSAGVFNFEKEYDLKQDQAKKVSNHFPVEVELKVEVDVAPPKTGQKRRHSDDSSKTPKKSKP
ncbi:hypothetical protein NQZ68_025494 [Dissostichus eleginoides]|nr:hypothetical protein NQZ68_025494 [Dissostichus eleginoides]